MTSWTLKRVQGDEGGEACAVAIWDQALARFREAQGVLDGARGEPDEEVYDALLDVHSEALCALLALPAPDLAGLAAKLDVIVAHLAWDRAGRRTASSACGRMSTYSPRLAVEMGSHKGTKAPRVGTISCAAGNSISGSAPTLAWEDRFALLARTATSRLCAFV